MIHASLLPRINKNQLISNYTVERIWEQLGKDSGDGIGLSMIHEPINLTEAEKQYFLLYGYQVETFKQFTGIWYRG